MMVKEMTLLRYLTSALKQMAAHVGMMSSGVEFKRVCCQESDDEEGEAEEVGNLQLAWEILEVAKVIYTRFLAKPALIHDVVT